MRGLKYFNQTNFGKWWGYLLAIPIVASATWLKYLAQPDIIPANVPILYLAAIIPAAIYLGLGPSLLVCILSILAFNFFFLSPAFQFGPVIFNDVIFSVIFLAVGILFSLLSSNLRRRNKVLSDEIQKRQQKENELSNYQENLEHLIKLRTSDLERTNSQLSEEIAKQKKAESENIRLAKESNERYNELQALLDNVPVAIWIARDPDCRTIIGNKYANALFGVHPGENISRSAKPEETAITYKVFRTNVELSPEELPAQLAASTGQLVTPYEADIFFTDSRRITILVGGVPLLDKNGVVRGSVAIGTDITDRKKVEEALQESNRNYRALFNNQTIALAYAQTIFNEDDQPVDYVILDVNSSYEKQVGILREQIVGKRVTEAFPGVSQDLINLHNKVAMTGKDTHFEIYVPTIDKWFDVNVYSPQKGYFVAMSYNITDRKKAEESLLKYTKDLEVANKDLEAFGYSVTHDMKQPLRALGSYSDLLFEDYQDRLDETGKDYLNRIQKASHFISELTEDMLKLFRVTRTEVSREQVNLSSIAQSTIDEFKANQPLRQVDIIITPAMIVNGDKQLLTIALRNLLENAWKFTLKCQVTHIVFGFKEEDGERIYFVKDNGIGFDMKYRDKLFQPFQRLTTDEDYPGTGIGLAIVQKVIRRHGGKVWADAEVNKGATFYLSFPNRSS